MFEHERSRPKPVDAGSREDMENSFEAAMRAADALFARPPPQQTQGPLAAAPDAAAEGCDAVASSIAPDRGGRILRALDEQPPPQLVALEAANAPKRRGRKPGSKNKPKNTPQNKLENTPETKPMKAASVDLTDEAGFFAGGVSEAAAPLLRQTMQTDVARGDTTRADKTRADTTRADTTAAQQRLEAIPAEQMPSNGSPSNGSKRFSWVRDRLKPGEGWKRRRLPRICW